MHQHPIKNVIGVVSLFTAVSIFIFAFFSFGPGARNQDDNGTTTTTTIVTTTTVAETTTEVTTNTEATTTTTTTATTTAAPSPVVIAISTEALMAQFAGTAQEAVQQIAPLDAIDRVQSRTFTGVAIRDILAWQGVNLHNIGSTATLNVGGSTLAADVFMAETTLLAWHEVNHNDDNAAINLTNARLIFGDEQGLRWGAYRQNITEITLEF
ncbi:MAG: hypothetical protein FWD06_01180 [Oscillospiraceae bacterium]|nr:hypothetical protein [Oscillospiraceae bacterium]